MQCPDETSAAPQRLPDRDLPYISVVATARNDDHGGNLLGRMQVFVDAWINQAKRHNLDSELILVEWNPPAGRDRLVKALRWPKDTEPCQVRIVEVPPEVHSQYRHAEALPLYQMIAKNVGIRRARSEFVLVTNIDIVFSDELVRFLAARRLQRGRMYRIDRYDVMSDVPVDGTLDEQLDYCRTHLLRLSAREGTYALTPEGFRRNAPEDITRPESGIYFGPGWFPVESYIPGEPFRWIDDDAQLLVRGRPRGGILTLEVEPGPGVDQLPQPLKVLDESGSTAAEWQVVGRTSMELIVPPSQNERARSFRFRVPGGGLPVPHDLRILNFRVFRCDWLEEISTRKTATAPERSGRLLRNGRPSLRLLTLPQALSLLRKGSAGFRKAVHLLKSRGPDIFETDAEYRVGQGWYDLEHFGGAKFRWVSWDAQLAIRITSASRRLALLVEPGPGLGFRSFELLIRRPNGKTIAQARVEGLTYIDVPIPAAQGTLVKLVFTVDGGGLPARGDPRTLNFRVFAIGEGVAEDQPAAATEVDGPESWTAEPVVCGPGVDWAETLNHEQQQIANMGRPRFLHCHGCGDFTLMAREHWFDVRGYAELDMFSMHLDSVLCNAAHYAGAREELLREPMRIYHIEHGVGSGWTPEGNDRLYERLARSRIPSLTYAEVVQLATQMRRLNAPVLFNLDDWGLAETTLPETTPPPATDHASASR